MSVVVTAVLVLSFVCTIPRNLKSSWIVGTEPIKIFNKDVVFHCHLKLSIFEFQLLIQALGFVCLDVKERQNNIDQSILLLLFF